MRFRTAFGLVVALAFRCRSAPAPEMRLVDLNVIALDNHGQPVMDLTRQDFQVMDAGKPQKVVFFRHYDSKLWGQSSAPDQFSNRQTGNIPRATVILFDLLNERFGTRGSAANELVKYLQPLESPDYLYLYLLTVDGRLYAVHGVPEAEGDEGSKDEPWTRHIKELLDNALREVTRVRPVDIDVAVRVPLTYQRLEDIAVELSGIPGRKNIVWITDGVPIELGPQRSDTGDFLDFTPQLRLLSAALDRSGIAIYPVRPVMLGSPDAIGAGAGGGLGSIDTVDEFAGLTGGRPDTGKDIGAAVRQALSDVQTSYQIGYYPEARNWDDKFHKLRITCTRKGVRIQSKTGYYAWREPPGARAEQAINAAVGTRFDAAEIGIRAGREDSGDEQTVRLVAYIDANDVAFAHVGDQYVGRLRFALVRYFRDSAPSVSVLVSLDIQDSAQQFEQAVKRGIRFTQHISLKDNVQAVRLIVFDSGSNTVGSVTVPVGHAR